MPLATSAFTKVLTSCWYAEPLGDPDRPSQQSSLSGIRTAWMFQAFIASMPACADGAPSHMPLPCTQANSPLDRLTPSSRYVFPAAVTSLLPETCRAGDRKSTRLNSSHAN